MEPEWLKTARKEGLTISEGGPLVLGPPVAAEDTVVIKGIEFVLPFPPTVNTYWRTWQGRMLISEKGRAYRKSVKAPRRDGHQPAFWNGA